MPRIATIFKILVASPSDVKEERDALKDIVFKWNASHSNANDVYLDLVMWETHVYPDQGSRPQEIINSKIVNDADLLIGIFWTRLGTPTGNNASGTVEEIERIVQSNKKALIYFSNKPISPDNIDYDQYSKVVNLKKRFQSTGIIATYSDLSQFKENVSNHLSQVITDIAGSKSPISTKSNAMEYFDYFPEQFEQDLASARNVFIFGSNQSDLLIRQYSILKKIITSGIPIKVIFHDPEGDVIKMSQMRFPGNVNSDHERMRVYNSLNKLDYLRQTYSNLEIRVIDYLMSYGGCIFNHNESDGVAYIKKYTFKVSGGSQKPKQVLHTGTKRYSLVESEIRELWDAASNWQKND